MGQAIDTAPLYEKTRAMNEALVLSSVRQHELTAAAESLNIRLQAEIREREQRERDALVLTGEIAHRVKNNLQLVVSLIAHAARSAPADCLQDYKAIQTRVGAVAELYDLISGSSDGRTVPADAYLRQIGKAMSASVLEESSGIKIDVSAEALDIDPERAVPFGLLVNELATNAIKHAFPDRGGRIVLSLKANGDHMELAVVDNGVGSKERYSAKTAEKRHGADYVTIFVRQLGGTMNVSAAPDTGTTVTIRFPLVASRSLGL